MHINDMVSDDIISVGTKLTVFGKMSYSYIVRLIFNRFVRLSKQPGCSRVQK